MSNRPLKTRKPWRYRLDRAIRSGAMRAVGMLAARARPETLEEYRTSVRKILLVRANYRIGNAVLTLPAVAAFRENFPDARIDFVGAPVAKLLFQNQALDNIYAMPRRFPAVLWQLATLLKNLRSTNYDLAVDVSCSQSGMGSLIVAGSGARIRAGCQGKWDQFFNLKIPKLCSINKYQKLSELLGHLKLHDVRLLATLNLSKTEKEQGLVTLAALRPKGEGALVGVFVGGRKLREKRWSMENFVQVIRDLQGRGFRMVTFLGPEEEDIGDQLRGSLGPGFPVIFEPSVRKFAAIVSNLDLFICGDSGPMHLACTVGVRVLAIFQQRDVERWAPPRLIARALSSAQGLTAAEVLDAALVELKDRSERRTQLDAAVVQGARVSNS
jgi:heptosyltransferase III